MRYSIRPWYLYGFLCGLIGLGWATYLQMVDGIDPCPLCVLTRIILMVLTAVFFIAYLHNPRHRGKWFYIASCALITLTGLAISIRHIWLQHLPLGEVPECSPGFDYLIETLPLSTALTTILQGSGECSDIRWLFLGLSLPEWATVGLVVMLIISLLPIFERNLTNKM